jgi:hypothetical protein
MILTRLVFYLNVKNIQKLNYFTSQYVLDSHPSHQSKDPIYVELDPAVQGYIIELVHLLEPILDQRYGLLLA